MPSAYSSSLSAFCFLVAQGLVPLLLQRIVKLFPVSTIYTPLDQVC